MFAGSNALHVGKSCDQADGSVTAHPQIPDVVKKNHARDARGIDGLAKQRSHNYIGTSRLVYDRGAEVIVFSAKAFKPGSQRPLTQVRTAADDQPGRFPAGMRINHSNSPGIAILHEWPECGLSSIIVHSYAWILMHINSAYFTRVDEGWVSGPQPDAISSN